MRHPTRLTILCAALFALAATLPASAAILSPVDEPNCNLRLEGQIESGDANRLRSLLDQDEAKTGWFYKMCLNSPGGAIGEAVALAELVQERNVGTVILEAEACLSACSLVFMLGTREESDLKEHSRRMHVTATLGFHRTAFDPDTGRTYSAEEMSRAFQLSTDATLAIVALGSQRKSGSRHENIPQALLKELLGQGGQDFYYVDTVGKAGRFNIEVFGYRGPEQSSPRAALNACANLWNWQNGTDWSPPQIAPKDFWRHVQRAKVRKEDSEDFEFDEWKFVDYWHVFLFDDTTFLQCKMQVASSFDFCGSGFNLAGQGRFDNDCRQSERVEQSLGTSEHLALAPPDTPLADLEATLMAIQAPGPAIERGMRPLVPLSCSDLFEINVSPFSPDAAIHEAPDPASAVLFRPAAYELLPTTGAEEVTGPDRASCSKICQDYDTEMEAQGIDGRIEDHPFEPLTPQQVAFRSCILSDAYWREVRMPYGGTGWISLRHQ
ncbi:hypothetical protein [Ponticoccus alexandrii]|uniref:YARHG domain-containing protein n=1 Tax=Ponticoccus alexandrii TaxID=1943633 RepID=A0ABX7F7M4_9RHOB|nr:hypothetical protein [Ponticoccus alexandrii]ETA52059.1 hypothetical protein P279_10850 [Rhodobacteraceae bacterium PD-2]QRF66250.1 hypothetical protein GQA70_07990 [Ponticoccus alexandrii]